MSHEDIGQDDMADAFGEILNIVAGATERKLPSIDMQSIIIGLPMFLTGADCIYYLSKGIQVCCQLLSGPDSDVEVVAVWKEDEPL
jgi:CheY-specific phosphatase CheX